MNPSKKAKLEGEAQKDLDAQCQKFSQIANTRFLCMISDRTTMHVYMESLCLFEW